MSFNRTAPAAGHVKTGTSGKNKRTHPSRNPWISIGILLAGGLFLLSLGFYIYTLLGTTPAPSTYAPADVIYGTPVYAVHQMDIDAAAAAIISTAGGPDLDPAAAVSDRFYDFGKIEAGRVVDHEFPIGNTGSGPLKIYEAHTTCGCTTAEFTAGEIPPGKVALMSLHFDPGFHNMRGQTVRRGIMIHTNDPHNPVLEIWVQATIQ